MPPASAVTTRRSASTPSTRRTALDFLKSSTSKEIQKFDLEQGSLAPVRADLYDDAALQKKYPYLPTLLTSIQNAVPRPVTPFYPAVTKAIQDNAYAAIKGQKTAGPGGQVDMSDAIKAASRLVADSVGGGGVRRPPHALLVPALPSASPAWQTA